MFQSSTISSMRWARRFLHFPLDSLLPVSSDAQYATAIYGDRVDQNSDEVSQAPVDDIENEIKQEIQDLRRPGKAPLFRSIKMDMKCGEHGRIAAWRKPSS